MPLREFGVENALGGFAFWRCWLRKRLHCGRPRPPALALSSSMLKLSKEAETAFALLAVVLLGKTRSGGSSRILSTVRQLHRRISTR